MKELFKALTFALLFASLPVHSYGSNEQDKNVSSQTYLGTFKGCDIYRIKVGGLIMGEDLKVMICDKDREATVQYRKGKNGQETVITTNK